jgi:LytR cell envelope-related transcriptional attenuator/tetratricopeptide repeat protein
MHRGGFFLATAAVLACTACLADGGKLEVRSTTIGLKSINEPVPFRIAEARRHLALGNVALALEGFRKAAREDPSSVDALAGIAGCYDQIGRFDLSRRHYEMALAIAPRDLALLALFGSSLQAQGLAAEAASVRREIAAIASSLPTPAKPDETLPEPVRIAEAVPVATPAPPAFAAPVGQSVTIALPPPRPVASSEARMANPQALHVAPVGKSVTIALPPPRPAPAAKGQAVATIPQAPAGRQPRLELTEVALVTGDGPRWKRPDSKPIQSAVRTAPAKSIELRLLNAARINRLAARTRAYLGRFGWREMAVGDAAAVRPRSLIVYPAGAEAAASRLSARLGFAKAQRNDVKQLTILLGRDAAAHPALRTKA